MIETIQDVIQAGTSRLRLWSAVAIGLLLVVGTVYASAPERGASGPADEAVTPAVAALEERVERLDRGWARLDSFYDLEVEPIARVLDRYTDDDTLATRVAAALVREGRAAGLEPDLLLGVLLVENPWLDPAIRSSVGAVGLMQVMPVHRGGWSCGWDLEDIDTNVCLGARVFAHYYDRVGGDLERALLRYNGCVTGSNTPDCHLYPSRVLERAHRATVARAAVMPASQGPSAASP